MEEKSIEERLTERKNKHLLDEIEIQNETIKNLQYQVSELNTMMVKQSIES